MDPEPTSNTTHGLAYVYVAKVWWLGPVLHPLNDRFARLIIVLIYNILIADIIAILAISQIVNHYIPDFSPALTNRFRGPHNQIRMRLPLERELNSDSWSGRPRHLAPKGRNASL
jgi:hypothetical protein